MEVSACRLCLATETKLLSWNEDNLKNILDLLELKINLNNALPKHVCELCKTRILRFKEFRKWCHQVQSLLDRKLTEESLIPKEFLQDINKTFPRNNLAIAEQFKIDISGKDSTELQNKKKVLIFNENKDGNTTHKDFLEEEMLPLNNNKEVIENQHKIKTEESSYEQYGVLNNDLVMSYDAEVSKCDRDIDYYFVTETPCKLENHDRNPSIIEDKIEWSDKNTKEKHILKIDTGNIFIESCNAKKTKTTNKKAKTTNKEDGIAKSLNIPKQTANSRVKKKYKKRIKGKTAKVTPVRRKYCDWLEELKGMTEESLKKYNMKLNKVLTKEEQMAKMLARKEKDKYKTSLFKCEPCCKGFMSEKAFKSHNLLHQPTAERPVECDLCHLYLGARSIKAHERQHRLELICLRCGDHVDPSKVKSHFEFHSGVKFQCKECNKVFYHNSTYRNHVRIHHADAACAICGELFNGRNGVVVHVRKSHAEEAMEQCEGCENYFCTKDALRRHLSNCSSDNSPCAWCGAHFPTVTELAAHIPNAHTRAASDHTHTPATHCCTECGRSFKKELTLACHWRKAHHDRSRLTTTHSSPVTQAEKRKKAAPKVFPTICDQCGVTVFSNYLPLHMLRHTGEKPHECPVCHKSFRIKHSLGTHMMIHRGEKPFKCTECNTCFRQSCHLARHMRIHTGEKPFECGVCHKAFSLKVNKDEHVRTVHEGLPPRRRAKRGGDV